MKQIIIKHSIFIDKPKEIVWNFTQDYKIRRKWDQSVVEATVIQTLPDRIVKLSVK